MESVMKDEEFRKKIISLFQNKIKDANLRKMLIDNSDKFVDFYFHNGSDITIEDFRKIVNEIKKEQK